MRDLCVSRLNALPGVTCQPPDGCYVAFANITQTGKTKEDRWQNVRSIFECTEYIHQPVMLVDDVITTGSTLEACIAALNQKGITRIVVLSFAAARIHP